MHVLWVVGIVVIVLFVWRHFWDRNDATWGLRGYSSRADAVALLYELRRAGARVGFAGIQIAMRHMLGPIRRWLLCEVSAFCARKLGRARACSGRVFNRETPALPACRAKSLCASSASG